MVWKPFLALPNYLGGKRRLCPVIFREIGKIYPPKSWPDLTLLDPCAGACSISLFAKAQGMRVVSGDIAERSYIVQVSIIANDGHQTLTDHDLGLLFQERQNHPHFVAENFVPAHFPARFADFLDLALANIADHPSETKQALLRLCLFKMMKAPRIQFSDTTISRATEQDRLEDLSGHKAKMAERWYLSHPGIGLHRVAKLINEAIFGNGHDNLAYLSDARDLVKQWASRSDILYLDPPYPGVTGYETYHVLDSVLAGYIVPRKRSPWSTSQFSLQLLSLLDVAQEIPLWVISYGSVGVDLGQLLDLIRAYRPARAVIIDYPHLQAIARREVAEANKEYLIIAERRTEGIGTHHL